MQIEDGNRYIIFSCEEVFFGVWIFDGVSICRVEIDYQIAE